MSYTPPNGADVQLVFSDPYTAPAGNAVVLNFSPSIPGSVAVIAVTLDDTDVQIATIPVSVAVIAVTLDDADVQIAAIPGSVAAIAATLDDAAIVIGASLGRQANEVPIPVRTFDVWRDPNVITGFDMQSMVSHQLRSPINGYLGSGYGSDTKALLQLPQTDGAAEDYLRKLRGDVPVLQVLPDGGANLFSVNTAPDRLDLVIEVSGALITIPSK